MIRRPHPSRAAGRIPAAAAAVAGLGVLGGITPGAAHAAHSLTVSAAQVEHARQAAQDRPTDVFTGTVAVANQQGETGKRPVYRYIVNVQQVYKGDISTQRVQVRTARTFEPCRTSPLEAHSTSYAFQLERSQAGSAGNSTGAANGSGGGASSRRFVMTSCDQVAVSTDAVLTHLTSQFGEPRDPVTPRSESQPGQVQIVSRSDTTAPSFTRMAAPGVALVIIGGLGLMLVRRLNRRT